MVICWLLFSIFAISRMATINQSTAELAENWMPSLGYAKDADSAFTEVRLAWRSQVVASTKEPMARAESNVADGKSRLMAALDLYDKNANDPSELDITCKVRADFADYDRLTARLRQASIAHDDAAAEQLIFVDMKPRVNAVGDGRKLVALNDKGSRRPR